MTDIKDMGAEELIEGITDIVRVSTARKDELLSRLKTGEKAIKTMAEILRLSKQLVYDEPFGGCVKKVILKWEKETNK